MSQVTASVISLPVTVVCDSASNTTMTVAIASTSVGLPGSAGQQDVLLPPPLILIDTMRGIVGFIALPQQQSLPQMGPHDDMHVVR